MSKTPKEKPLYFVSPEIGDCVSLNLKNIGMGDPVLVYLSHKEAAQAAAKISKAKAGRCLSGSVR